MLGMAHTQRFLVQATKILRGLRSPEVGHALNMEDPGAGNVPSKLWEASSSLKLPSHEVRHAMNLEDSVQGIYHLNRERPLVP
jgi:hypothetical protein